MIIIGFQHDTKPCQTMLPKTLSENRNHRLITLLRMAKGCECHQLPWLLIRAATGFRALFSMSSAICDVVTNWWHRQLSQTETATKVVVAVGWWMNVDRSIRDCNIIPVNHNGTHLKDKAALSHKHSQKYRHMMAHALLHKHKHTATNTLHHTTIHYLHSGRLICWGTR